MILGEARCLLAEGSWILLFWDGHLNVGTPYAPENPKP